MFETIIGTTKRSVRCDNDHTQPIFWLLAWQREAEPSPSFHEKLSTTGLQRTAFQPTALQRQPYETPHARYRLHDVALGAGGDSRAGIEREPRRARGLRCRQSG